MSLVAGCSSTRSTAARNKVWADFAEQTQVRGENLGQPVIIAGQRPLLAEPCRQRPGAASLIAGGDP